MDSGKVNKSFIERYEQVVGSYAEMYLSAHLAPVLAEKRAFGLRKYGEISFQSSKENAIKVNTIQHALEELIDYMNYTLHEMYRHAELTPDEGLYAKAYSRLLLAQQLYELTSREAL